MSTTVVTGRLKSFVERIERLEEDKAAIAEDIKQVYAEAKGDGYDVKTLRAVIRERKKEPADRQEQLSMFDLYWGALHGGADESEIEKRKAPAKRKGDGQQPGAMQ